MTAAIRTTLAITALMAITGTATAQAPAYPAKPIHIIIPAGSGGGVDTIGRLIGQRLNAAFRQPVVMDNRPGAATRLGSELLAKAPPDGYTLLAMTDSHAINGGIQKDLRYDPVNDFAPITLVATTPYLLAVHPSLPVRTIKELVSLARRNPGRMHFASAGTGSGTHLAFELFQLKAKIQVVHVPYKSGSAAVIDVAGGQVDMYMSNTINVDPFLRTGRLRALAITTMKRSRLHPDLPTVDESGVPGYSSDAWYGMLAPARTPADIIMKLNREIVAMLRDGDARDRLNTLGAEILGSTPEEFGTVLRNDVRKWTDLAKILKLQLD